MGRKELNTKAILEFYQITLLRLHWSSIQITLL